MRISILALGSRGDVQPCVALGRALVAEGHSVRVVALADYEDLIEAHGLRAAPVVGLARELLDFELVYAALDGAAARSPLAFARRFVEHVAPLLARLCADCLLACQGAEALICTTLGAYPGELVAERLGLPLLRAHLHPVGATAAAPSLWFAPAPARLPLRGPYHRLTHHLAEHGLWQMLHGPLNRARREALGLPPLGRAALWRREAARGRRPTLYGYSERLLPRPADWPPWRHVTGFWLLDPAPGEALPPAVEAFLAAGPPPVYVGFGSILAGRDAEGLAREVLRGLALAGARGILYGGAWGDFARIELPPDVMRIEDVPHGLLFPRVAAVVTHAGAGTTVAALRAGAPVVGLPVFGDQPLWAGRVAELGAGPPPLPRAALTAEGLAAALGAALGAPAMARRARELGAALEAEAGARQAAQLAAGLLAGPGMGPVAT